LIAASGIFLGTKKKCGGVNELEFGIPSTSENSSIWLDKRLSHAQRRNGVAGGYSPIILSILSASSSAGVDAISILTLDLSAGVFPGGAGAASSLLSV